MHIPDRSSRRRRVAALAAIGLLVLSLSACGSSTKSTTSTQPASSGASSPTAGGNVIDQVKALLDASSKDSEYQIPGPPVDATKVTGKKVFMIVSTTELPFVKQLIAGVQAAGKAAGLDVTVGDSQNQTTEAVRLLTQAVNQKVSAIILFGMSPESVATPLTAAKAAGIPTILSVYGDPSLPTGNMKSNWGIFGNATFCFSCAGALVADYAIVHTNAAVNALMTYDPATPASVALKTGFEEQLKKWCPSSCKAEYVNTPASDGFRSTGTAGQASVQRADLNFIFPQFDGYIEAVLPAIRSAGAESRVAVGSVNADLVQMQEMKAGTPVKVDIGSPVAWSGWAAVDQVVRALTGGQPAADEHLPLRAFTAENISQFDLNADPGTWYGAADYRANYKKLWGLGL